MPASNGDTFSPSSTSTPWRCPGCHGELQTHHPDSITCVTCNGEYAVVAGIPDLRFTIGNDEGWTKHDLATARERAANDGGSLEAVIQALQDRPEDSSATQSMRVNQILTAPAKFKTQFDDWLYFCRSGNGLLLDIGCGTGGMLAAAASIGIPAAGIDASMNNLVAAKRMIEANGGKATLACAWAERLPLAAQSIGSIIMYDSIEHVGNVEATIAEACRVLLPGGRLAMSTPNRFSLTREPHVLVWGVGWLPRRLQERYVYWRTGQAYDHTRLMSTVEMSRRLGRQPGMAYTFRVPPVPREELESFPPWRAGLARLYNRICQWRVLRPLLLGIGPFYQVIATRTN